VVDDLWLTGCVSSVRLHRPSVGAAGCEECDWGYVDYRRADRGGADERLRGILIVPTSRILLFTGLRFCQEQRYAAMWFIIMNVICVVSVCSIGRIHNEGQRRHPLS
jgi:hypothetical protein